jgi:hypothetical protein
LKGIVSQRDLIEISMARLADCTYGGEALARRIRNEELHNTRTAHDPKLKSQALTGLAHRRKPYPIVSPLGEVGDWPIVEALSSLQRGSMVIDKGAEK